jgi:DNA repair protein RecO (recombination protein O)
MLHSKTTKAIVLKRQDYREHDSLVIFYTEKLGKVTLIARGTKKPKSKLTGHIEPLNLVNLMIIPGKGYDYAAGISSVNSFLDLKEDLNNLHFAFSGVYWFFKLISESETDERLFKLLNNYLINLNQVSKPNFRKEEGELFYAVFCFRMLAIIGYEPQIKTCLSCGQEIKPDSYFFDLQSGGLICSNCFLTKEISHKDGFLKISSTSIRFLRFIFDNKVFLGKKVKIDKKTGREIALLAEKYLQYRL